jgi:hypothetical protein
MSFTELQRKPNLRDASSFVERAVDPLESYGYPLANDVADKDPEDFNNQAERSYTHVLFIG